MNVKVDGFAWGQSAWPPTVHRKSEPEDVACPLLGPDLPMEHELMEVDFEILDVPGWPGKRLLVPTCTGSIPAGSRGIQPSPFVPF
jgi:hypothetical protein